jgi:hypothetical protein
MYTAMEAQNDTKPLAVAWFRPLCRLSGTHFLVTLPLIKLYGRSPGSLCRPLFQQVSSWHNRPAPPENVTICLSTTPILYDNNVIFMFVYNLSIFLSPSENFIQNPYIWSRAKQFHYCNQLKEACIYCRISQVKLFKTEIMIMFTGLAKIMNLLTLSVTAVREEWDT